MNIALRFIRRSKDPNTRIATPEVVIRSPHPSFTNRICIIVARKLSENMFEIFTGIFRMTIRILFGQKYVN